VNDLVVRLAVFALVGLVVGYLSGLFGMGGGILRIPIFVHLFPLFGVAHPVLMHMSLGTSQSLVIPTSIETTWTQYKAGNLDVNYYRTWALGVFCGVIIGLLILPFCSTEVLRVIFTIFLASVAIYFGLVSDDVVIRHGPPKGLYKLVIATLVGMLAALTGTSGGTITTPTMKAFEMQIKRAIALASSTGVVTGTIASLGAIVEGLSAPGRPPHSLGFVDLAIFAAMAPTTLAGAAFGVRAANRLSKKVLRRCYTIVLFAIVADMVWGLIS